MDEAPKQKTISIDGIVAELSGVLEPDSSFNIFSSIVHDFGFMPEDEAISIMQKINDCYTKQYPTEQRTKEVFDNLYVENYLFRCAIQCLQKYARNNLLLLTGETLATIENPELVQSCIQLNTLPHLIKKYIMEKTLDDYNDTSTIALRKSWKSIVAFDICDVTHQAATGDAHHTLRLWDLKTAQPIHSEKTKHSIKQICFNHDGSLVAIRNNKQIAIWEPADKTFKLRYTIQFNQEKLPLYHMCYAQETSENVLSIFHKNTATEGASLWITNPNANAFICFQKDIAPIDTQPLCIEKGNYSVHDPDSQLNPSVLQVIKKNCHPLLLCKIAAQQTKKTEELSKIFSAKSYQQLTPHDCDDVYRELKKNPCFNKNTSPATLAAFTVKIE
jgi:WD40 repeat protein